MPSVNKKRIFSFDLLKVLSILVVISHHMMMDMYAHHSMFNLSIIEKILIRTNVNIGMVVCGMFVLLSGATLALKGREEKPLEFYKKRLLRLVFPFYFAYIIYFIIKVINEKTIYIFGGVPKWRFLFTICGMDEYLSANGIRTFSLGVGEWFLGCIILCYLAYPFLYKAHKKNRYITFFIMTIYWILVNVNYDKFHFVIASHMNFLCQIYNFYLGIFLIDIVKDGVFDKIKETKVFKYIYLIILIGIFSFFYYYKPYFALYDNVKATIDIIALFCLFYYFENVIQKFDVLKKGIMFFNKISLEIYLVHHFIIYQVDYMLNYRQLMGVEAVRVIIMDCVLIILVASIVEYVSSKLSSRILK